MWARTRPDLCFAGAEKLHDINETSVVVHIDRRSRVFVKCCVSTATPDATLRCPNGSNLTLHYDVLLARPTNDDEPLALEQRHGARMSPVRVTRRQRRVRLHKPAATLADRLERAAKRGTCDTAPAPTNDGNEAGDAPAYPGTQGRDASVQTSGAGQWQLLGRAELAPPDGLAVVVDENAVCSPGVNESALFGLVLGQGRRSVWEPLGVEVATALVQHAGAERPTSPGREQALEVGPCRGGEFLRGVPH